MKLLKINLILLFSLVVFQFISFPQLYSTNQVKLFTPLGTDNFGYTLNTNLFWSIEIDSKGNIWAGSYYQGLFKYGNSTWTNFPGTKLHMGDLLGLEVDNNDNIWLASNSNKEAVELRDTTIYRNTVPDSLSSDFLPGRGYFACVISSGNNIYYAGYDSCLYKFDGNTFTTFTVEGRGSPPNGYLYGLAVDKNDHIWYGTIYNSVMEFDGQNFIPHHPTTGNNIGSIYSITVDNYNNKWICGDNGSIFKLINR